MAEFGEVAKIANDKVNMGLDMAAAPIESLQKSLQDQRNLTLMFPAEAISATDAAGVTRAYKFTWELMESRTYRTAYYSWIRATGKSTKNVKGRALEKEVKDLNEKEKQVAKARKKKNLPTKAAPTKSELSKQIIEEVRESIKVKYAEKFAKVAGPGIKIDAEALKPFTEAIQLKFGVSLLPTQAANPEAAAKVVADAIIDKRGKEFEAKFEKYRTVALEQRLRKQIEGLHPGASEAYVNGKVAAKVAAMVEGDWQRSVVVAFEISYNVFKPNEGEITSRWRALDIELGKAKGAEIKDVREGINELSKVVKDLSKSMAIHKSTGQPDDPADIVQMKGLKADIDAAREEIKRINERYAGYQDDIKAEKAKVAELIKGKRLIGNFTARECGNAGPLQTTIAWRNTNATFTAKPMQRADGAITLNLSFSEQSIVEVPRFGNILGNMYACNGGLTFKADGTVEVDGKMGVRCKENLQPI